MIMLMKYNIDGVKLCSFYVAIVNNNKQYKIVMLYA